MKKIIIFLIIAGLLVLCFILTDGFTDINGYLDPDLSTVLRIIATIIAIIDFLYLISGIVKKHTDKMGVVPFRELR